MLTAYENTGVASASAVQVTQCLPPILHLAGDIRPFKRKISAKPKRLMEPHKERIYLAATTQATSAELVLIRGLPGSAKATIASVLSMIGYLRRLAA